MMQMLIVQSHKTLKKVSDTVLLICDFPNYLLYSTGSTHALPLLAFGVPPDGILCRLISRRGIVLHKLP